MSDNEVRISALIGSRTIREATARAEVSKSTVYRRLKEPAFREQYREARREVMQHAISRLQQGAADAVEALVAVVRDETGNHAARVAAAWTLLDQALRATEQEDILPRLEALEANVRRAA